MESLANKQELARLQQKQKLPGQRDCCIWFLAIICITLMVTIGMLACMPGSQVKKLFGMFLVWMGSKNSVFWLFLWLTGWLGLSRCTSSFCWNFSISQGEKNSSSSLPSCLVKGWAVCYRQMISLVSFPSYFWMWDRGSALHLIWKVTSQLRGGNPESQNVTSYSCALGSHEVFLCCLFSNPNPNPAVSEPRPPSCRRQVSTVRHGGVPSSVPLCPVCQAPRPQAALPVPAPAGTPAPGASMHSMVLWPNPQRPWSYLKMPGRK